MRKYLRAKFCAFARKILHTGAFFAHTTAAQFARKQPALCAQKGKLLLISSVNIGWFGKMSTYYEGALSILLVRVLLCMYT